MEARSTYANRRTGMLYHLTGWTILTKTFRERHHQRITNRSTLMIKEWATPSKDRRVTISTDHGFKSGIEVIIQSLRMEARSERLRITEDLSRIQSISLVVSSSLTYEGFHSFHTITLASQPQAPPDPRSNPDRQRVRFQKLSKSWRTTTPTMYKR